MTAGVLFGSTTLLGSPAFTGRSAAHPKPENHDLVWGDDIDFLDGEVRTYATTNPSGNLSSLGVYLDDDALAAFDEDGLAHHLHLPEGVDTHEFTFVGFHYNPAGHPPPDVYTVPHYDVHFYLLDEETVEGIPAGPATYDLPENQVPTDYSRLPVIDSDDDGEPDTPVVEEDMGEHLADLSGPEFQEGGEFTHTMIYGAYDADGDGIGRITFVEPMVTTAFLDGLASELVVDMKTPEVYERPGDYPTQYVVEPGLHGGRFISIDGFTEFPGPDS